MGNRVTRNEYYMELAEIAAKRSSCSRASVWAVIVKDWVVVTTWYNWAAKWESDCLEEWCIIDCWHCVRSIHAEENAIINCAKIWVSLKDSEIYVTHYPCNLCSRKIINAWIKKVYYQKPYQNWTRNINLEEYIEVEQVIKENSIILTTDKDLVNGLIEKVKEYEFRINKEGLEDKIKLDASYKKELILELLKNNKLEFESTKRKLKRKIWKTINRFVYHNAWYVIKAYNEWNFWKVYK